eukprot:4989531-Pleurochrysis_carterae.AAC.1
MIAAPTGSGNSSPTCTGPITAGNGADCATSWLQPAFAAPPLSVQPSLPPCSDRPLLPCSPVRGACVRKQRLSSRICERSSVRRSSVSCDAVNSRPARWARDGDEGTSATRREPIHASPADAPFASSGESASPRPRLKRPPPPPPPPPPSPPPPPPKKWSGFPSTRAASARKSSSVTRAWASPGCGCAAASNRASLTACARHSASGTSIAAMLPCSWLSHSTNARTRESRKPSRASARQRRPPSASRSISAGALQPTERAADVFRNGCFSSTRCGGDEPLFPATGIGSNSPRSSRCASAVKACTLSVSVSAHAALSVRAAPASPTSTPKSRIAGATSAAATRPEPERSNARNTVSTAEPRVGCGGPAAGAARGDASRRCARDANSS